MNCSKFRFKATVDFIVIRVALQRPSNGWSVSDRMFLQGKEGVKRRIYADPIDESDGRAATVFDLRIHDPKNYKEIENTLALLERKLHSSDNGFKMAPEIRQIEISFDAYPKERNDGSPRDLSELTVRFTEWIQRPAGKRRAYRSKKDVYSGNNKREHVIQLVADGWMLGMGDRDSDHLQRAYYKTKDQINRRQNTWRDLPLEEHRARFENNFSGHALINLSLTTTKDLATFRFESLAEYFSFRTLGKPGTVPSLLTLIDSIFSGSFGNLVKKMSKNRLKTKRKPHTIAHAQLNQRARQALTDLSDRWSAAGRDRTKNRYESNEV